MAADVEQEILVACINWKGTLHNSQPPIPNFQR